MGVSIKDIASRAGTSNVTVSLALRDSPKISQARRAQIKALAKEMGYRVNPLARAMRMQRSLTVGVLLPHLRSGVNNLKVEAIEHKLVEHGYQVLLGFTKGEPKGLTDHLHTMIARRVDALVIYGQHGDAKTWPDLQTEFGSELPPCVLADPQIDVPGVPCVHIDRAAGMALATQHLLDLGHRDIAYLGVGGSQSIKWTGAADTIAKTPGARLRFLSLWTQQWHETPEEIALATKLHPNAPTLDLLIQTTTITQAVSKMPAARRPTAFLTMSDTIAMQFINALSDVGINVPRDISICGFDGTDAFLQMYRPKLTTVRQPQEKLADSVLNILLDQLAARPILSHTSSIPLELLRGDSAIVKH